MKFVGCVNKTANINPHQNVCNPNAVFVVPINRAGTRATTKNQKRESRNVCKRTTGRSRCFCVSSFFPFFLRYILVLVSRSPVHRQTTTIAWDSSAILSCVRLALPPPTECVFSFFFSLWYNNSNKHSITTVSLQYSTTTPCQLTALAPPILFGGDGHAAVLCRAVSTARIMTTTTPTHQLLIQFGPPPHLIRILI